MSKRVTLVAAVADNGVIGDGADIPWKVPGEQAEFKALTMGHVLVMGRTTYESIGRPLPGRTTVVLTRDPSWNAEGVHVAHGLDAALALAQDLPGEVMVVGGAEVYAAALPVADEQVLTRVHLSPDGDVHYPAYDAGEWTETRRDTRPDGAYDRVWLQRRSTGPRAVLVAGVSGSGKSTVGEQLAEALGATYVEGDDLHPESNRQKMSDGVPLTDEDRWPWLDEIARTLAGTQGPVVAACSALKRSYRDRIREGVPYLFVVLLDGDPDLLRQRQAARKGHFMPTSLMDSQLATLEPLGPDEAGARIDVADQPAALVEAAMRAISAAANR